MIADWLEAVSPARFALAGGALAAWGGLCWRVWRQAHPRSADPGEWSVLHASQTGTAAALAGQSAALLGAAPAQPLDRLSPEQLAAGGRFLFVVATCGDGDAPDHARHFLPRLASWRPAGAGRSLAACQYAVLALGDDRYPAFCAFGRQLDAALAAAGARAWQPLLTVNRGDPEALAQWFSRLGTGRETPGLAGIETVAAPAPAQLWRLCAREHLNPGSPGGEVHRLLFEPAEGALPEWQAGDLARIELPGWNGPRDYSIASLPGEGRIELLVRRQVDARGQPGLASHFLCRRLAVGACVPLRLQRHAAFHLGDNARRPLILLGQGVGLAGLLAHLKSVPAGSGQVHWLMHGERCPQADDYARRLLAPWRGSLRLDCLFSRASFRPRRVPEQLRASAGTWQAWLAQGAAVYVCGSRRGIGDAVDEVLREVLGEGGVERLRRAGRYRRDVF